MLRSCLASATLAALVTRAGAHGSMVMPASRNSVDAETPAWSDNKHPMTGTIQPYNCRCTNGTSQCNNGQSCFWCVPLTPTIAQGLPRLSSLLACGAGAPQVFSGMHNRLQVV